MLLYIRGVISVNTAAKKKPVFTEDQLITASDAAKKFGAMSNRAQKLPLFVTQKTGKPKTVLIGYKLYEKIYSRLAELEEASNNIVIEKRLNEIKADPIGNSVSWRDIRRTDD